MQHEQVPGSAGRGITQRSRAIAGFVHQKSKACLRVHPRCFSRVSSLIVVNDRKSLRSSAASCWRRAWRRHWDLTICAMLSCKAASAGRFACCASAFHHAFVSCPRLSSAPAAAAAAAAAAAVVVAAAAAADDVALVGLADKRRVGVRGRAGTRRPDSGCSQGR
jgi:hypothetical protein